MRTGVFPLLMALAAVSLLAACTSTSSPDNPAGTENPDPPPVQNASERPVRMAILDFQFKDFDDDEALARYAQADLVILDAQKLWTAATAPGVVNRLKAINPDLKVLGYVRAKHVLTDWSPEVRDRGRDVFPYDLYDATRPYWSWTTTGDTLMDFRGAVVLNITRPACRQALIDVYHRNHSINGNTVDGFYWDYFSPTLWISPNVSGSVEGEPDLDRDGVSHFEDADEQEAFRAGQVAMIEAARSRFGEDFIMIFNGTRAHRDSTFAALGDGMFYELFPTLSFHGGPMMANALDPAQFNNLFAARRWPRTRNGGPWLLLSNRTQIRYRDDQGVSILLDLGDINRAVALLTDATAVYHSDGRHIYGWPEVDIRLGPALGGVTIDGPIYTREFERGRVTVTMTSGDPPFPFDYEIVQDGQVVQSLQFPSHFP